MSQLGRCMLLHCLSACAPKLQNLQNCFDFVTGSQRGGRCHGFISFGCSQHIYLLFSFTDTCLGAADWLGTAGRARSHLQFYRIESSAALGRLQWHKGCCISHIKGIGQRLTDTKYPCQGPSSRHLWYTTSSLPPPTLPIFDFMAFSY